MSDRIRYRRAESTPDRHCVDCSPLSRRPAPYPGPRCATHHRQSGKRRQIVSADRRRQTVYGLTPEQHKALSVAQGGRCAICRRATGATKALAVDHDHASLFVRGLLCSRCNRMLGHLRDSPEAFFRAALYLLHPPAFEVIGQVKAD